MSHSHPGRRATARGARIQAPGRRGNQSVNGHHQSEGAHHSGGLPRAALTAADPLRRAFRPDRGESVVGLDWGESETK